MRIGVLALQGSFAEHVEAFRRLGVPTPEVRLPEDLEGLRGLVIPGGESTTISHLLMEYGLFAPLSRMIAAGFPVWGTCAGMIVLAKDVGMRQPVVGVMDVKVRRNAFGRQVDSFETELDVPALERVQNGSDPNKPFHAIFIRAPLIDEVGPGVEVLAKLDDGTIVAARQGNVLATSFHPELTEDARFHRYFLERLSKGRMTKDE
jgi:5'-phosphate synthase pdxT subunit